MQQEEHDSTAGASPDTANHNVDMMNRALPEWMSKRGDSEKDALKQVGSGFLKKNVIEDDLPYLHFTGSVVYSQEKNDCSFLSEDLRSGLAPGSAVGFDIEWPPCFEKGKKKKVAMVQLCVSEDKCYLFHLSSMSGFPAGLKMFLEDENIRKVGVGIEGDMWRLLSDFEIKLKSFVELGDLANERLRCMERWSLDGLAKHLFKHRLSKQKDVRCSNWDDFLLSEEQKGYAATDAYAGLIIYNKLHSIDPEPSSFSSGLKEKLLEMASEMEQLAGTITEEVDHSATKIVEDISVSLNSLKDLLTASNTTASTSAEECLSHSAPGTKTGSPDQSEATLGTHIQDRNSPIENGDLNNSNVDLFSGPEPVENGSKASEDQRECIMSLDVSEYELQELERQARQEDLEEQTSLEFQEKRCLDSATADVSYEVESDQELESAMLQFVEEADKLRDEEKEQGCDEEKETSGNSAGAEEDEEDLEELQEEEFDPSLPEPKSEQIKCLKMYFGHSRFKPVQWKVIHSVLRERRDNLVVMATGYGKSLCYQFPPVYCGAMSVVISPLIALMEDQVLQLQMSNIPACFLGSAQTKNVFADLKEGQYRVVYMTPEFCSSNISLLELLNKSVGICMVAVDEAHCISEWGHDFRGAYRNLGKLKRCLPDVPIVALTATASPSIREDIVKSLNLDRPVVTCTSFDRPNLFLEVQHKSGNMAKDMMSFLQRKQGGDYEFEGSSIVYCPTRKEAEKVTAALYKLGISCGVYHAGLGIKERRETQYRFMRDEIQCIVATVAFGMGINKPDIRKVIHYGAPKEMESYYQEIGRAGRDGLPSACHVLWTAADITLNRFLLSKVANERFRGYKLKMMGNMTRYLSSLKCRRKLILSHFEDKQLRKVTSGILGTDQCCDNCKTGTRFTHAAGLEDTACEDGGRQDFGPLAYQLIGAVSALEERFGTTAPIRFLRGSSYQKLPDKYRRHHLFGVGKSVSEVCWKALIRELIMEDYLKESSGASKFCTLCKITTKGRKWFNKASDEQQRSLLLQPNSDLSAWSGGLRRGAAPASANASRTTTTSDAYPSTSSVKNLSGSYSRPAPSKLSHVPGHSPAKYRSPSKAEAKPQPPPVSPRELQLQTELYGKLVAERQKLASEKDIPPAILATNKILLDMAKIRPCTVASLKLVDGVSEAKSSMLAPLLRTIAGFCEAHQLKVDSPSQAPASEGTRPPGASRHLAPLPDSVSITYRLFQEEGKSIRQVCDVRTLQIAVVEAHLLQAYRASHPLDTERAGLTPAFRKTITDTIQAPPIYSDLRDVKAIRARLPDGINGFLLHLTLTELEREGKARVPPAGCSGSLQPLPPRSVAVRPPVQSNISWIEPQDKALVQPAPQIHRPAPRTHLPAPQTCQEPDEMESEDELFRDFPMPEQETDMVESSRAVPPARPAPSGPKAAAQTSALDLASWSSQPLDEDTQGLFSSSPPENVSQPSKRKLPDWAGATRGPIVSASMKNAKKKKGLFS